MVTFQFPKSLSDHKLLLRSEYSLIVLLEDSYVGDIGGGGTIKREGLAGGP
jgi:hypothetical protein